MPLLDRSARAARALALAAAGALAMTLLPAQPAAAANSIGSAFFGTHDSNPIGTDVGGWPLAPVGSVRLWDAGVSWRDIETAPGVFDFTRLDAIVDTAKSKGAEIVLVLGQTPAFYASRPTEAAFYGPGAASVPKDMYTGLASWRNYIQTIALRYKGRGIRYQVWNEANIQGFFTGSPRQMAALTKIADDVLRTTDPAALVVGPSFATRLSGWSGRLWIDHFFNPAKTGRKVQAYMDVVALHLYPVGTGTPESAMTQLRYTRAILRKYGVSKPIWNTEVNYGVVNGAKVVPYMSNARQAAWVARTYVLNAGNGIKRVHWYSWDLQNIASTRMTYADQHTVTPAGKAFSVVRSWMVGARVEGCTRNSVGTYTCTITYASGKKRVYWNPSRVVYVKTAGSATWKQGLDGVRRTIRGGVKVRVGESPIVVRSRR